MEDGKAKGQGVYEIIVAKGEQSCRTRIIFVLKNLNIKKWGLYCERRKYICSEFREDVREEELRNMGTNKTYNLRNTNCELSKK